MQEKCSDGSGTFDIGLVRSHVITQWSSRSNQQNFSYVHLTDHGLLHVVTALLGQSQISGSVGHLLGVLLNLMGDAMASL